MVTATATAWIAELHRTARPSHGMRRSQVVSTAANLGGIGTGPLVAGFLAQWVKSPLTVPFVVALGAMGLALVCVIATPETRERLDPRPTWRPQRVSVPPHAVAQYIAGGIGAAIAFAVFGLFTSLAPAFLAGSLHHPSLALAGATAFEPNGIGPSTATAGPLARPIRTINRTIGAQGLTAATLLECWI